MIRRHAVTIAMAAVLTLGTAAYAPVRAPASAPSATAVFAGGCYWGMESVFEHVRGVDSVVAGFATPGAAADSGGRLSAGHLGFAEAVKIVYDPSKVSYQQLLGVLFTVAHDPTQLDRQGPDVGTRYRSAVFVQDEAQHEAARQYLAQLKQSGAYRRPIVTDIVTLKTFRAAPPDQQDFAEKHPDLPYIRINDVPKIKTLHDRFPDLYRKI